MQAGVAGSDAAMRHPGFCTGPEQAVPLSRASPLAPGNRLYGRRDADQGARAILETWQCRAADGRYLPAHFRRRSDVIGIGIVRLPCRNACRSMKTVPINATR